MRCFAPALGSLPEVSRTAKKILLVVALAMLPAAGSVLVLVAPATAVVVPSACPSGPGVSLNDYLALGNIGCIIDDKLFSDFSFQTGTVSAGNVTVTPITTPGNPGFTFGGTWTHNPAVNTGNSSLSFDVSSLTGSRVIQDASVKADFSCAGSTCGTQSGLTGATLSVDLGCTPATPGFPHIPPCAGFDVLEANSIHNTPSDNAASFTPAALVGVDPLDFDVNGNPASITSETVQFSELSPVPEPSSIMLVGTGLMGPGFGAGILRRRP